MELYYKHSQWGQEAEGSERRSEQDTAEVPSRFPAFWCCLLQTESSRAASALEGESPTTIYMNSSVYSHINWSIWMHSDYMAILLKSEISSFWKGIFSAWDCKQLGRTTTHTWICFQGVQNIVVTKCIILIHF